MRTRIEAFYARERISLPYWTEGSDALACITSYVSAISDPGSEAYVDPSDRIAVFDFDGTLYGERFPTYFDTCLFLRRALQDEDFTAAEDVRACTEALKTASLKRRKLL